MASKHTFGTNWWTTRWIEMLESFGWDSRLQRGRSYARNGRVFDLTIAAGRVSACVQGRSQRPYRVSMRMKTLSMQNWRLVVNTMGQRAVYVAKLLAGEMPADIEEVFAAAGTSLLPQTARDLKSSCSCPDEVSPCKHVAAVHYHLAAMFDDDPFLLFLLRGCGREQIMAALRTQNAGATISDQTQSKPENLQASREQFWGNAEALARLTMPTSPLIVPKNPLDHLVNRTYSLPKAIIMEHLAIYYGIIHQNAMHHMKQQAPLMR